VLVQWGYNSDDRGLLQCECHLVGLVVPQMVDSVALPVVEVLLLPIQTE
jgi:hypothetical protein